MDAFDDNSIEPSHLSRLLTNVIPEPAIVSGTRRRVFTPTAINTIRVLAAQGKAAAEIATAIGSTPASVRVKCCQLKIPLRRRWEQALHIEGHRLIIYLQDADYAALKRKSYSTETLSGTVRNIRRCPFIIAVCLASISMNLRPELFRERSNPARNSSPPNRVPPMRTTI